MKINCKYCIWGDICPDANPVKTCSDFTSMNALAVDDFSEDVPTTEAIEESIYESITRERMDDYYGGIAEDYE